MRVLISADTVGGVWTYAVDLVSELVYKGYEIGLATMGRRLTSSQHDQIDRLPHVTLYESEFKLEWMEEPEEDLERAGEWLLSVAREFEPDIVHLNHFCHSHLPFRVPVVTVYHSSVSGWWRAVHGRPAPDQWSDYERRLVKGLQASDTVVAPTQDSLTEATSLFGPFKRSLVIPNSRSVSFYSPGEKENFVLSAGRIWDPAKNTALLADAAEGLSWPVKLAGEGSCSGENIEPLGFLTTRELAVQMGRASIYCAPAKYEPFGLSILEAAMSGCALVLGDIPSLRENWEGAARFVSTDDSEGLRRTLNALINHESERQDLASKALERSKRFSGGRFGSAYDELYRAQSPHEMSVAGGSR